MWFSITTGGELSTIWFNIFSGPATPVFSLEHYGVEKRCLVQGGDYAEVCAAIPDELEDSVCAHAKGGGPTSAVADMSRRACLKSPCALLQHLPAHLLATAALFGATAHHVVALEPITGVAASLAGVRAGGADQVHHGTVPGRDVRCGCARRCAVLTSVQRFQMVFLPVRNEFSAVRRAGLA